ncbi:MAG: hypothetical protein DWH80_16280 [Planctomycetota bacterium]|nr:MAG: hypothetical protein DWH80_16280 [Planctomycetota bacterium]
MNLALRPHGELESLDLENGSSGTDPKESLHRKSHAGVSNSGIFVSFFNQFWAYFIGDNCHSVARHVF